MFCQSTALIRRELKFSQKNKLWTYERFRISKKCSIFLVNFKWYKKVNDPQYYKAASSLRDKMTRLEENA